MMMNPRVTAIVSVAFVFLAIGLILGEVTPRLARAQGNGNKMSILERLDKLEGGVVPVGAVVAWPSQEMTGLEGAKKLPEGWMLCDGTELTIKEYPELFEVIKAYHGSSGEGRFRVPDYRGYFLRGSVDPLRPEEAKEMNKNRKENPGKSWAHEVYKRDPDRNKRRGVHNRKDVRGIFIGTVQDDMLSLHRHWISSDSAKGERRNGFTAKGQSFEPLENNYELLMPPWDRASSLGTEPRGGQETRPKNVYVHWIIKVKP